MGAAHSLFKGAFLAWAFVQVYGFYDPQWRCNFHWWYEWHFIEPNPEIWERQEEYCKRYVFDKLMHDRDGFTQAGESHFYKYFLGTENEGEYWGSAMVEWDEVVDQIYRVESRVQRNERFTDNLRQISEYPLPEFTGKKELPPNRIWSKVDETYKPKHFCVANMLWETPGFVDYFEAVSEENDRFEDAIAEKYKDPKLRELYWDLRREGQENLAWDLYDLLPYLACNEDKKLNLSAFLQNIDNQPFINQTLSQRYGAHYIFDRAGVVPFGDAASASLLEHYDPAQGPWNEKLFF